MPYFDPSRILELHAAGLRAGLHLQRGVLLGFLAPAFAAALPAVGNPSEQLLSDLQLLNDAPSLPDGTIPLRSWLEAAVHLAQARNLHGPFAAALAELRRPSRTSAAMTPSARKHLLDDYPYDLSRPEARELRDLLARSIRRDKDIEVLLEEVGIPVEDVDLQGSSTQIWTSALRVAAEKLRLRALVSLVRKKKPALEDKLLELERTGGPAELSADVTVTGPALPWKDNADADGVERLLSTASTLLDVSFLDRALTVAKGVVLVKAFFGLTSKTGTAFRVGPRYLLTNHHVAFADDKLTAADKLVLQLGYQAQLDDSIAPGEVITDEAPKMLAFGRQQHPARDWALVELSQPLPGGVTTIPLAGAPTPELDDRAYIIQHPQGLPKKIGLNRNLIRYVDADVVQYLTDTEQGSSGAPVFNERWQLIALHYRYIESKDEDKYGYRNQGMRIEPIVAELKAKGIDLTQ